MAPGVRGPGNMPVQSLPQRLAQAAGRSPGDNGLYLENQYLAVPGEGIRGRRYRPPPEYTWLIRYGVQYLLKALRYANPGINVRLPSHINPPFRSVAYNFQLRAGSSLLGTTTRVTFNGQSFVPEGVQGVISDVFFGAYGDDVDVNTAARTLLMTISKNSVPIAGFLNLRPGYTFVEVLTDIVGSQNQGAIIPSPSAQSPIKLEPGDVIDVFVVNPGPFVDSDYVVRFSGWLYPIEVEGDGIIGTMADRGGFMMMPK